MTPEEALTRLGGCARWGELVALVPRRAVARAIRDDRVRRVGRGRLVLPSVAAHRATAHAMSGTLSHLSAALHHGWKVKWPPEHAWVTLPRKRHPRGDDAVNLAWADLGPDDVRDGVTTPVRTVLDCARRLPFDEALAVADSALRAGDVTQRQLVRAAALLSGPGAVAARRVAREADGRAANPMESVLRAITLEIEGLHLTPQLQVADRGVFATVDLGDPELRLALESEGFEAHSSRRHLHRDARRYTELGMRLWTVLRYSWEDVMLRPGWVRWTIEVYLAERAGLPDPEMRADGQAMGA